MATCIKVVLCVLYYNPPVAEGFRVSYQMEPEGEKPSSSTAFSRIHAGIALLKSELQKVVSPLVPAAGRCSWATGNPSATIKLLRQHIQNAIDGFSEQDAAAHSHPDLVTTTGPRPSEQDTAARSHPDLVTTTGPSEQDTAARSHPDLVTTTGPRPSEQDTAAHSHPNLITTTGPSEQDAAAHNHPDLVTTTGPRPSEQDAAARSHPDLVTTLRSRTQPPKDRGRESADSILPLSILLGARSATFVDKRHF